MTAKETAVMKPRRSKIPPPPPALTWPIVTLLAQARHDAGIMQRDLAARVCVHGTVLSRVERGMAPAYPRLRLGLSKELQLSESKLFDDEGFAIRLEKRRR